MYLLLGFNSTTSESSPTQKEHKKKSSFKRRCLTKTSALFGVVLIAVIVVSCLAFYQPAPNLPINEGSHNTSNPTPIPSEGGSSTNNHPQINEKPTVTSGTTKRPTKEGWKIVTNTNGNLTSTEWKQIATYAWKYYQPGGGVDTITGLPWTSIGSPYITDWDIGVYIQAVIDSQQLNFIGVNGTWGFDYRIDKVLTWLETRELNSANYPYWFYKADDGKVWKENADKMPGDHVDIADTGRLFVALNNLKAYNQFANRVDNLVYNNNQNRSNYRAIIDGIKGESYSSTSIYSYLIIKGFESFWPVELSGASGRVLDNIFSSGETFTPENVSLPKAKICGDPLLCSLFDIKNVDERILTLVNKTYTAHEAYYISTGKFRAFGEGPQISTDWQWEWVVLPDGRTWMPLNDKGTPTEDQPVIYNNIAVGFLAVYNTVFTVRMAIMLENGFSESTTGYYEGIDEQGNTLNTSGCLIKGLIIGAALYYINNHKT